MIITKLNGGIGNQLFQYAAGKNLAIKNNTILKLDLSDYDKIDPRYRHYDLNSFNIEEKIATEEDMEKIQKKGISKFLEIFLPYFKRTLIKYHGYDFDPDFFKIKDNVILDGYWQSEKYFIDSADAIRKEFTLKNEPGTRAKEMAEKIVNAESVSLHIRRGDYLSGKFSSIYPVLATDYYLQAINLIAEKTDNPVFFIFSDDIEWVKNNLKISYPGEYVSDNNIKDYEEIILMSKCRHNIIANSSFSWWGAWLNSNPEKIVIAPEKWFNIKLFNEKDLLPSAWYTI